MYSIEHTCCFTGHRASGYPWGDDDSCPECLALKERMKKEITALCDNGITHFISGMANGADLYFASIVIDIKKDYPDVILEAAIPCDTQSSRWNKVQKAEYNRILACCDMVTYVQHVYTRDCMMKRNKYLVDNAATVLACFNGTPGGTMNTLVYAKRNSRKIIIINPEEYYS